MTTYLVTGGAGFVGSNIVHYLLEQGATVRVLDNFSTGRRSNLAKIYNDIEVIEGDLRSSETCRMATRGVEYVLHQGAMPSVQRSVVDPFTSNDTNTNATLNMLVAARDAGVHRFVFASSSSIYGDSPTLPKQEEMAPHPKSPYAVAKMAAENFCRIFFDLYGLETVCLRYFNVFGPRQDPASQYSAVIPIFIRQMISGEPPLIYGDGLQSRDFTFVQNNIAANLLATTVPNIGGQLFNIACGTSYTLINLVDALNTILGTNIEAAFDQNRKGDVKHSLADIRRAQDKLGYRVDVQFLDGLRKTVEWYSQ